VTDDSCYYYLYGYLVCFVYVYNIFNKKTVNERFCIISIAPFCYKVVSGMLCPHSKYPLPQHPCMLSVAQATINGCVNDAFFNDVPNVLHALSQNIAIVSSNK